MTILKVNIITRLPLSIAPREAKAIVHLVKGL